MQVIFYKKQSPRFAVVVCVVLIVCTTIGVFKDGVIFFISKTKKQIILPYINQNLLLG